MPQERQSSIPFERWVSLAGNVIAPATAISALLDDRMFLVPDRWSPSDSTLLVGLDNSVRVQFQFINQAP